MKGRYEVGLEKLLAAEKEVNIMKVELIQLQPKLIETGGPSSKELLCCSSVYVPTGFCRKTRFHSTGFKATIMQNDCPRRTWYIVESWPMK